MKDTIDIKGRLLTTYANEVWVWYRMVEALNAQHVGRNT